MFHYLKKFKKSTGSSNEHLPFNMGWDGGQERGKGHWGPEHFVNNVYTFYIIDDKVNIPSSSV